MSEIMRLARPFRDEDLPLLGLANELAAQLGLPTNFTRGLWMQRVSSDRCLISHETLLCPMNLIERLNLEDWKPLIVTSLIYDEMVHSRKFSLSLFPTVCIFWFLPMLGFLVPFLTVPQNNPLLGLTLTVGYIPVFLLVGAYGMRAYTRRLQSAAFTADVQSIKTVPRNALVQTLKKIEAFGQTGSEAQEWFVRASEKVTIAKRIEHLSRQPT